MTYRISELANIVGLSRTALLYYEKLTLIEGQRKSNGYRVYSERDVQRLKMILKLQAAGLTLSECKLCLEEKLNTNLLQHRLDALDNEIAQKQESRTLLAAMLGKGEMNAWHLAMDADAPDLHLDWLKIQGFSEKEALRLIRLSKDMNTHEQYMADFMKVFETLDRWAPGSEDETLHALQRFPTEFKRILEIGCGKGLATEVLLNNTEASLTVVDNEESALSRLSERLGDSEKAGRVTLLCESMTELTLKNASFDLIWSEGSAYIMGVEKALKQWRPFLEIHGFMMLSDLVWFTDSPSKEPSDFWEREYPDMQSIPTRIKQMKKCGYELVADFSLSQIAWENYFIPLEQRARSLQAEMPDSNAIKDIIKEIEIYQKYLNEFGYQMFLLRKC